MNVYTYLSHPNCYHVYQNATKKWPGTLAIAGVSRPLLFCLGYRIATSRTFTVEKRLFFLIFRAFPHLFSPVRGVLQDWGGGDGISSMGESPNQRRRNPQ